MIGWIIAGAVVIGIATVFLVKGVKTMNENKKAVSGHIFETKKRIEQLEKQPPSKEGDKKLEQLRGLEKTIKGISRSFLKKEISWIPDRLKTI